MGVDETTRAKLASDTYFDATSTIRHYDTQRATFASLSLSALAFLTGFASTQAKVGGSVLIFRCLALTGLLLAVLSVVVVAKLASLVDQQRLRARSASDILHDEFGMTAVRVVDERVRDGSKASVLRKLRLSSLWIAMFAIFAAIELLAVVFSEKLFTP
jgi:hypothetical protein